VLSQTQADGQDKKAGRAGPSGERLPAFSKWFPIREEVA